MGCKREDVIGQHKSKLIQWGYTERSASELSKHSKRQEQISVKALKTNKGPIEDEQKLLSFSEPEIGKECLPPSEETDTLPPLSQAVHSFEQEYIRRALNQNGGNVTQTAKQLGIHCSAIYRKLDQIPLEKHSL